MDGEALQSLIEPGDSRQSRAGAEQTPRVLVISHVRLVREGVAAMLRGRGLDRVVLDNGATLLDDVQGRDVDVVIIDLSKSSMLALLHELALRYPRLPLLALGVEESDAEVLACADAGAAGFLPPECGAEELETAIGSALRDELVCSPRIAALLFRRKAIRYGQRTDSGLTRREREVLMLVDRGLTNKEIAGRLHISVTTVKNHVHNILEKLHVPRRGAAAASLHIPPRGGLRALVP